MAGFVLNRLMVNFSENSSSSIPIAPIASPESVSIDHNGSSNISQTSSLDALCKRQNYGKSGHGNTKLISRSSCKSRFQSQISLTMAIHVGHRLEWLKLAEGLRWIEVGLHSSSRSWWYATCRWLEGLPLDVG